MQVRGPTKPRWEQLGSPYTMRTVDEIVALAQEINPSVRPHYVKYSIALYPHGRRLCLFRPPKHIVKVCISTGCQKSLRHSDFPSRVNRLEISRLASKMESPRSMSALPPKADIRPRDQDVCFGPISRHRPFLVAYTGWDGAGTIRHNVVRSPSLLRISASCWTSRPFSEGPAP